MQAQLSKAAPAPLPTIGFSSLQASHPSDVIIIHARPKEGKTTCALTASPKFDPTKSGKGVVVDDIAIISFEKTGLSHARSMGYEFKYLLDMSPYMDEKIAVLDKVLESALQQVSAIAQARTVHTVVVDGLTTLDCCWAAELSAQAEGWELGRRLNTKHKSLLMKLTALPANVIITMHSKVINKMDADKKATLGLDPEDTVVIDLSAWDGPKFYRAQCSLMLPLQRVPGKTPKDDQYYLYPRGVRGAEAGGRYPQVTALDKVPANVQELYKLIAASAV